MSLAQSLDRTEGTLSQIRQFQRHYALLAGAIDRAEKAPGTVPAGLGLALTLPDGTTIPLGGVLSPDNVAQHLEDAANQVASMLTNAWAEAAELAAKAHAHCLQAQEDARVARTDPVVEGGDLRIEAPGEVTVTPGLPNAPLPPPALPLPPGLSAIALGAPLPPPADKRRV